MTISSSNPTFHSVITSGFVLYISLAFDVKFILLPYSFDQVTFHVNGRLERIIAPNTASGSQRDTQPVNEDHDNATVRYVMMIILCCSVLCSVMLCYVVLCCVVLCCVAFCCVVLC